MAPTNSLDALLLEGFTLDPKPASTTDPQLAPAAESLPVVPVDWEDPVAMVKSLQMRMQRAGQEIAVSGTESTAIAKATQIQASIVNDLQGFLQRLSATTTGTSNAQGASSEKADTETGTGQSATPQGGSGRSTQSATPRSQDPPATPPSARTTFETLRKAWGHLPDRELQRLDSLRQVEFLPEYEQLIGDYYRSLLKERP